MVEPDRAKGGHGAHSLLRTSMSGIWASCLFTFSFPFLKGLFFLTRKRLGTKACDWVPLNAACLPCAGMRLSVETVPVRKVKVVTLTLRNASSMWLQTSVSGSRLSEESHPLQHFLYDFLKREIWFDFRLSKR